MLISRIALVPKLEALVSLSKTMDSDLLQRSIRHSLSMAKELSPRKAVFEFSRYVARIAMGTYISRANAKRIFRVWFHEAKWLLPMGSCREHWQDFWQAVPKVKYPSGVCLGNLFNKAHGEGKVRLESLVHILSKYHGGQPFALSCEALAPHFGVSSRTISRWIESLVSNGVLVITRQHDFRGAVAREYQLKTLEKKPFEGDVLHAVIQSEQTEAERSVGVCDDPARVFLERVLNQRHVLEGWMSADERAQFEISCEVFEYDEEHRAVAQKIIRALIEKVRSRMR